MPHQAYEHISCVARIIYVIRRAYNESFRGILMKQKFVKINQNLN